MRSKLKKSSYLSKVGLTPPKIKFSNFIEFKSASAVLCVTTAADYAWAPAASTVLKYVDFTSNYSS